MLGPSAEYSAPPSPSLMHAHGAVISVCQMAAHPYAWLTEGLALPRVNAPRQPRETEARIRAVTCQEVAELGFHQCCLLKGVLRTLQVSPVLEVVWEGRVWVAPPQTGDQLLCVPTAGWS